MNEPDQVQALLEEIRDLQREQLAESRERAARSIRIAEEAVARQAEIGGFYRRVVAVAVILVAVLMVYLWWLTT